MKTYVITISKTFPATHPRKGEPTGFETKISSRKKKHTIRGNYDLWKKRIDEINDGAAVLSVREWTGKPYASKQKELFVFGKGQIGIQKCSIQIIEDDISDIVNFQIDGYLSLKLEKANEVMANDGLDRLDFIAWFKKPLTNGCIIHFTDLRY